MLCPVCGCEAFCEKCINIELIYANADTLNQYLQISYEYLAGCHDGLSQPAAAERSSETVERTVNVCPAEEKKPTVPIYKRVKKECK